MVTLRRPFPLTLTLTLWCCVGVMAAACKTQVEMNLHGGPQSTLPTITTEVCNQSNAADCGLTQGPAPVLLTVSVLIARPGDVVELGGKYFREGMKVRLDDFLQATTFIDEQTASFVMPNELGTRRLKVSLEHDPAHAFDVISNETLNDLPLFGGSVHEICSDQSFYDVSGTVMRGSKNCSVSRPKCSHDGETNCIANKDFPAVATAQVEPDKLSLGQTVGGVAGSLAQCNSLEASGCITTTTYPAQIKNTDAVTHDETNHNLMAGTVRLCKFENDFDCLIPSGFKANHRTSVCAVALCTLDGQQDCIADGSLKAANVATLDPWDLRAGLTAAGVAGALKTNCRNGVNNLYNYDGFLPGLASVPVATGLRDDFWDTSDDYYQYSPPNRKVTYWSQNTFCDATTFADVTTNDGGRSIIACNETSCIYRDRITELDVAEALIVTTPTDWSGAMAHCAQTTNGGYPAGSWRLPTQKESMSLYNHGLKHRFTSMTGWFWTATSYAADPSIAWVHEIETGNMYQTTAKSNTASFYCVRGGAL